MYRNAKIHSMSKRFDAVVVGGGVIGCAVAYELQKAGVKVVLLERGTIGQESSSAAAGMLAPNAEADQDDEFLRLCLKGRALFPRYLEELEERTSQQVEWHQSGLLRVPGSEEEASVLARRYQWQKEAGIRIQWISPEEIRELEPHLKPTTRHALYLPDEANLDNAQLTRVLALAARSRGAEIREHEEVRAPILDQRRVLGVTSTVGAYYSGTTIYAAGAWTTRICPTEETSIPVIPVRGQMLALRAEHPLISRIIYSRDGYLVPRSNGEILVGATVEWAGFDKRNTAGALERLLQAALNLAPELESATFTRAWAGLRPGTPDTLPILGPDPFWQGLIHATGHYRNGILLSGITAKLTAELVVQGRTSFPLEAFSPDRFHVSAKTQSTTR